MASIEVQECPVFEIHGGQTCRHTHTRTQTEIYIYCIPPEGGGAIIKYFCVYCAVMTIIMKLKIIIIFIEVTLDTFYLLHSFVYTWLPFFTAERAIPVAHLNWLHKHHFASTYELFLWVTLDISANSRKPVLLDILLQLSLRDICIAF